MDIDNIWKYTKYDWHKSTRYWYSRRHAYSCTWRQGTAQHSNDNARLREGRGSTLLCKQLVGTVQFEWREMKGLTCEDLNFWLLLALRIDKDNDSLNQTFLGLPDNASETTSLCLFVFCFIPDTLSCFCFPQPLFFFCFCRFCGFQLVWLLWLVRLLRLLASGSCGFCLLCCFGYADVEEYLLVNPICCIFQPL